MKKQITSIQTEYQGRLFRSRLEARWAVFFDSLGLHWDYEPEGFDIGGKYYLPDFYLNELDCWVEIKATKENEDLHWEKIIKVSEITDSQRCVLLAGPMKFIEHKEIWYQYEDDYCFIECPMCMKIGLGYGFRDIDCEHYFKDYNNHSLRLHKASVAALSARFEHGEKGAMIY